MSVFELELSSEAATRKAAHILGELLREQPIGKTAFVLALEGELGAGKTTFIRGLAKGLGIREKITSPSFLIAKCYQFASLRAERSNPVRLPRRGVYPEPCRRTPRNDWKARTFWHFDFYRFNRAATRRDLDPLHFQEILRDPYNIVAVEWAERVARVLARGTLRLQFEVLNSVVRRLTVSEAAR